MAQKVAKLHSIEMPISKHNNDRRFDQIFDNGLPEAVWESYRNGRVRQLIRTHGCQTLETRDLLTEMQWIRTAALRVNSPVVFSHCDLNRRNILVTNRATDANTDDPDIYLIDFDWSCYMFRGADIGDYFINYCYDREMDFGGGPFPTDPQMEVFVDAYIAEMTRLSGDSYAKQAMNSRQTIIKEAKVFALMSYVKELEHCVSETNKGVLEYLVSCAHSKQCIFFNVLPVI